MFVALLSNAHGSFFNNDVVVSLKAVKLLFNRETELSDKQQKERNYEYK